MNSPLNRERERAEVNKPEVREWMRIKTKVARKDEDEEGGRRGANESEAKRLLVGWARIELIIAGSRMSIDEAIVELKRSGSTSPSPLPPSFSLSHSLLGENRRVSAEYTGNDDDDYQCDLQLIAPN
jgi:hypothetical protein